MDHFYVLADRSLKATPNVWARAAIDAYHEVQADAVVGEVNYGGDMVKTIIGNNVTSEDGNVPVKDVRATRGKKVRAEPVHDLYQQHRVHHAGRFERLEEEMTTWVPDDSPEPNPGEDTEHGEAVRVKVVTEPARCPRVGRYLPVRVQRTKNLVRLEPLSCLSSVWESFHKAAHNAC